MIWINENHHVSPWAGMVMWAMTMMMGDEDVVVALVPGHAIGIDE
jgi:hypothetical protein